MKFILAKKLGMTQVFEPAGKVLPVTLLEAGPMKVTQVRVEERDGYQAVQVGFGTKRRVSKPLAGHLGAAGAMRWLREFRVRDHQYKVGDTIDASVFERGDTVAVSGVSKGRGFAGVVKRHGFAGHPKTHGTKHAHREPGSIGATHPQHVVKGRRMAGHMGAVRVTIKNLKVVEVDPEKHLLALEGAVPGAPGSLVEVRG